MSPLQKERERQQGFKVEGNKKKRIQIQENSRKSWNFKKKNTLNTLLGYLFISYNQTEIICNKLDQIILNINY